ncbi:hypothetical protein [Citrobacter phage CVT22]|uniref:Uncharacterized protein n=1 Tax=Citrobacter phage CVT22 TaxID=1622234 RepID=A0A0R6BQ54_9CAUD|nr:hypothetical protein APL39_gp24 [Citrobacter phage CVT22]AJT60728.1 hypothetical protein [Citrobacter phage CVT22]
MFNEKDVVVVIKADVELELGKVLMVKSKLGFDGSQNWYLLTDGGRDYLVHGSKVSMSVPFNVEEASV